MLRTHFQAQSQSLRTKRPKQLNGTTFGGAFGTGQATFFAIYTLCASAYCFGFLCRCWRSSISILALLRSRAASSDAV
jgi:hypothetical protein